MGFVPALVNAYTKPTYTFSVPGALATGTTITLVIPYLQGTNGAQMLQSSQDCANVTFKGDLEDMGTLSTRLTIQIVEGTVPAAALCSIHVNEWSLLKTPASPQPGDDTRRTVKIANWPPTQITSSPAVTCANMAGYLAARSEMCAPASKVSMGSSH